MSGARYAITLDGMVRTNRDVLDVAIEALSVSCWLCHHAGVLSADPWPDDLPVPWFGPRMVCTRCGRSAPMNWTDRPARPSLTGEHRR